MVEKHTLLHVINRAVIIVSIVAFTAGAYPDEYDSLVARAVVDSLDISQFKSYIKGLADLGGREYGTQSNTQGREHLISTLEDLGYENVETQSSNYRNVYCTKLGSVSPDSVYIVSAHYDGMPVAEAANDDASGCALVLEGARVFANPLIKTHYSIRFILWNAEEKGLLGAKSYAGERKPLQGTSEPRWLGLIQHDMILFDHGLPPQNQQIPDADIDVEYQANSAEAAKSLALSEELVDGCEAYAPDYPADIGNNMSNTDSDPFKNYIAAVSVRENERISEIGNYSDPHWHTATDLYDTFSEKDFLLGFNCLQMTIGTVCRLAGVYDSTPVSIEIPQTYKQKQPILFPVAKEIKIFDTQGRKIAEHPGSCNWLQYSKSLENRKILPAGLYIFQLISAGDNSKHRFLQVVN